MGRGAIADPDTGKSPDSGVGASLLVLSVAITFIMGFLVVGFVAWVVGLVATATASNVQGCSLLHPLMIAQAIAGGVAVLVKPIFFSCPTLLYTELLNPLPQRDNYPLMAPEKFQNHFSNVRSKRKAMEEYANSDWGKYLAIASAAAYFLLLGTNCVVALVPGLIGGGQACKADAPFMWWCACLSAPISLGTGLCLWGLMGVVEQRASSSSSDDDDY